MPLSSALKIAYILLLAKPESPPEIRCPHCGERRRIASHGCYWRYRFEDNQKVAIPRHRCGCPACPRRTFSTLPYPLLPVIRLPAQVLIELLEMIVQGLRIGTSACARWLERSWHTARRAWRFARAVAPWILAEHARGSFGSGGADSWIGFQRAFSHSFFPGR